MFRAVNCLRAAHVGSFEQALREFRPERQLGFIRKRRAARGTIVVKNVVGHLMLPRIGTESYSRQVVLVLPPSANSCRVVEQGVVEVKSYSLERHLRPWYRCIVLKTAAIQSSEPRRHSTHGPGLFHWAKFAKTNSPMWCIQDRVLLDLEPQSPQSTSHHGRRSTTC